MATAFGHYELHELLGRGGMGEVYRALDRNQDRFVALKLLSPLLASDAGFVERFKRESRATAMLNDPHVIPIHNFGEIDGRLYIDMRLVEGADLAQLLTSRGPMPAHLAASFVRQAAEALDSAHARGLVHRDVKPSNLLMTEQGFVYLVDFGLVQALDFTSASPLTSLGQTIGTFAYMAPERMETGFPVDGRSDVYSLTCVLYEALTGRPPFPAASIAALTRAHLDQPPPRVTDARPDLPGQWDSVIARGMAKDPAQRFPTAGALAAAAEDALRARAGATDREVTIPGPIPPRDDRPETVLSPRRTPGSEPAAPAEEGDAQLFARRRPWVIAAVVAAAVVVLAGGVIVGAASGWWDGSAAGGSDPTPPTTTSEPPITSEPPTPPPSSFLPDPVLAMVFPDLTSGRASCERFYPEPNQLLAADGVTQPLFVAECQYAEAPGATVYFHRWYDQALGPGWVEALRGYNPTAPGFDSARWATGELDQGPIVSMLVGESGPSHVQIVACFDRAPVCVSVVSSGVDTARAGWETWRSNPQ